ncbi:MAG: hypothetical protein K0S60_176 [Evtepia sp.]|jgi:hypothetical protein|nr:hypothetical protein [Evtepia sp.]
MKKFKKFAVIGLAVLVVSAMSVTALAASYKTPAEVVAGLTGKTVDSVIEERNDSGNTYGTIANDAGKLDEFKSQMLEQKKELLKEKVAAGTMSQERADAIIKAMEQNQANCDGTGSGRIGQKMGAGFGGGMGNGQGRGQGSVGCGQGSCGDFGQTS